MTMRAGGEARTLQVGVTQAASGGAKAMFSQALSGVLVASILLATSISTSFAQNDDSDFIKNRNSYPLWNGSLKRDIQGFKPGMTESEAKQRLPDCEVSDTRFYVRCPRKMSVLNYLLANTRGRVW